MKKQNPIREAIDESLSAVHFTAADERAVLRAVHKRAQAGPAFPRRAHVLKRRRLDLVFSLALLAAVVLPAAWMMLRAWPASIVPVNGEAAPDVIVVSQGSTAVPAASSPAPSPAASSTLSETAYIAAARACFEEHCDTSVFSFEEYTVSTQIAANEGGQTLVDVELHSIYDNGCSFTVYLDMQSGGVVTFTAPALATQPQSVNLNSPQVRAWFDKYGADSSLWPEDAQAEFARRYEGKAPLSGESKDEELREERANP